MDEKKTFSHDGVDDGNDGDDEVGDEDGGDEDGDGDLTWAGSNLAHLPLRSVTLVEAQWHTKPTQVLPSNAQQ